MSQKELRQWKKVFENDLPYVVGELKETVLRPAVIILSGEMGVGKTSFAKAFAGEGMVQSPTYSIITETSNVAHADFYRLESDDDILHLELGLYAENKDYFLVEWGKKFARLLVRELDDHFNFYELCIDKISAVQGQTARNYQLVQLDRNQL